MAKTKFESKSRYETNPYRKKAGFSDTGWLLPGAWKAQLGDKWRPEYEDMYNAGIIKSINDIPSSPEQLNDAVKRAETIVNEPTFVEKLKGAGIAAKDWLKDRPAEQKRESLITPEHEAFLKEFFPLLQKELPAEHERLKSQREMPYLQQAFGEYAPYAGALGATLLGQLTAPQAHPFTSNEPGDDSNLQGQLLGSLLGTLVSQSPQIKQYGQQGLQQLGGFLQQRGSSALDYLRNLVRR